MSTKSTESVQQMEIDPEFDHYDFPTVAPRPEPFVRGHPGHTTPIEDATVYQLRMMLQAEGHKERLDTLTLLRFLRACKFNVMEAKAKFVGSEAWRAEFGGGVDNLVREFKFAEKAEVSKYYPQFYHKTDKDGRPVYIEKLGKVPEKMEDIEKITTQERLLENLVVEYEKLSSTRLPACSRKAGRLLETCCSIMDLEKVGWTSFSKLHKFVASASKISQENYPERLGKLYVINAPWGFATAFAWAIKPMLDPVTVAKIHVLDYHYQKELLKQIPAENLPIEYGGTCVCPGGCKFSDAGPWHEEKFMQDTIPATESHIGEGHTTTGQANGNGAKLAISNGMRGANAMPPAR